MAPVEKRLTISAAASTSSRGTGVTPAPVLSSNRPRSVHREPGSLEMSFRVTDLRCELPVRYTGVLPDLFREGQGVVAHGRIGDKGDFEADTILAKHDENYMAPEVAESMAEHVSEQTEGLAEGSVECISPSAMLNDS